MAIEKISFPEHRIPDVVRVIRRGLKGEKDKELIEQLGKQCDSLEDYYNREKEKEK